MLIYIGLREKYGIMFSCWFFYHKIVDLGLLVTYFGVPQIVSDHTFFGQKVSGGAPGPPYQQFTGHLHTCYVIIFFGN